MSRSALAVALVAMLGSTTARADHDRALAVGAAIFPGVIVHGSGHWVAGDRKAAKRIALAQLVGLGMVALGGLPLAITGGAPQTLPGLAPLIPGCGLLLTSWFADIYGAAGGARIGASPRTEPARLELEAGYLAVTDARTGTTHAATLAASAWLDRGHAAIAGWAGADARELGGELGVRVLGGAVGRPGRDGSFVDVVLDGHDRRFDADGIAATTLTLAARGRYDLARVAPSLAGSFVTGELGAGGERLRFDSGAADVGSVAVARFGYGVGFGRDAEVEVFYDHRHDTLAGRLVVAGLGSNGFVGHFGLQGAAYRGRWGVTGGVEVGAHWVARLAIAARIP